MFHCLFMHLEEISLLDINNVVYMVALNYVYKPPINSLKAFGKVGVFVLYQQKGIERDTNYG